MDDPQLYTCLWVLLTALIWGCTNPFVKKGAKGIEQVENSGATKTSYSVGEGRISRLKKALNRVAAEAKWCLFNWKLTVPFAVNQSGSLLFFYSLSQLDLSLVVPITNSLTTVFTAIMGRLLGEEKTVHNVWCYFGMSLVCIGSGLCIYGKV